MQSYSKVPKVSTSIHEFGEGYTSAQSIAQMKWSPFSIFLSQGLQKFQFLLNSLFLPFNGPSSKLQPQSCPRI